MATFKIRIPGREPESAKPKYLAVSQGYFETMRIRLLAGRDFTARDEAQGSTAVIVNEAFVRQYFPGENPLGRGFEKVGDGVLTATQVIVGVVRDAKYDQLREPNAPTVHGTMRRVDGMLEVRTARNPLAVAQTRQTGVIVFRGPHGYISPTWYARQCFSAKKKTFSGGIFNRS